MKRKSNKDHQFTSSEVCLKRHNVHSQVTSSYMPLQFNNKTFGLKFSMLTFKEHEKDKSFPLRFSCSREVRYV